MTASARLSKDDEHYMNALASAQPLQHAESSAMDPPADNHINVLIVDDSPINRAICKGALTKKGFKVRESIDGCAALAEVNSHPPDVVLMDVMMPNMDGLECTRRLKASERTRDIPVIIVSACTDANDIVAGLEAGADEYLGKPLRIAELEVRIRSVFRLFRNQKAALRATKAEAIAKALEAELVERRRMEDALLQAKQAAETANQAKSEFLATMSHELRTPLNGVIGMTELLLRTDLNEQQRRYAAIAKHSGDTLLCLINDILDFSKIEAGKVELERTDFDLRDTLASVVVSLEERAKAKGLELASAVHPQAALHVLGDPGRIQQVLMNLIANAIKFTDRGRVTVRAVVEDESTAGITICFTINDTGIGIPTERINRLFQSFSQLDASTTRKYGGTGLGLAICKRLVELMGGTIGVSSEPDLGSTFWFTVTLERAPVGDSMRRPVLDDIRRLLVLAVDDNAVNRETLHHQLTGFGISVQTVPDAQSALLTLQDAARQGTPFGIALLDMQMPGVDGVQLAQAIKADSTIQDTVLVMLSSSEARGDLAAMQELGFAAWLSKPVSASRLLDAMTSALACATRASPNSEQPNLIVSPSRVAAANADEARILLVDDNEIGREVATATLAMLGYRCDIACDGEQAIDAAARKKYDLILMDCQMPTVDGFEATLVIRRREARQAKYGEAATRIPIIALTANAMKGDRERCIDAGMDGYLAKPFPPEELSALLDRFLLPANPKTVTPESKVLARDNTHTEVWDLQSVRGSKADPSVAPFQVESLLKRWDDNLELVTKLICMFQAQAPDMVAELEQHIKSLDAHKTAQVAHGLKGAAAYVSAEAIRRLAAQLEEMGRASDLSDATDIVRGLREELHRCQAFDRNELILNVADDPKAMNTAVEPANS